MNTQLKVIPETVGNMVNLKELYLPTTLEEFPSNLERLEGLLRVDLNNNSNLKKLPDISKLKKLNFFSYTLYKNENYTANKAKLKKLQKELPNCSFGIKDEKGEPIDLTNPN